MSWWPGFWYRQYSISTNTIFTHMDKQINSSLSRCALHYIQIMVPVLRIYDKFGVQESSLLCMVACHQFVKSQKAEIHVHQAIPYVIINASWTNLEPFHVYTFTLIPSMINNVMPSKLEIVHCHGDVISASLCLKSSTTQLDSWVVDDLRHNDADVTS